MFLVTDKVTREGVKRPMQVCAGAGIGRLLDVVSMSHMCHLASCPYSI